MLGDQRNRENTRRFLRPPAFDGDIATDAIRWHWAISEASNALGFADVDAHSVLIEQSFKKPAFELYSRIWYHENKSGKKTRKQDLFESIRVGAVLSFNFMVTQSCDPRGSDSGKRPPSVEELINIFTVIGSNIGISPWGSKFGYGRFKVLSLDPPNNN